VKTLSPDTSPEAERVQIELLRQASDARRVHMVAELCAAGRALGLARLRVRHPCETRQRLLRRLAAELYGDELVNRACGLRITPESEPA